MSSSKSSSRHSPRHQRGGFDQLGADPRGIPFLRFNYDGNDNITTTELAGSMAKMGHPLFYKELSEMMRQADTNGDDILSFH
ncbi:Probable calcium-binding protein CML16 [Linum perenne]